MSTLATPYSHAAPHPVQVHVEPALEPRNRLTTAFRLILAIPHLLLVGGPLFATLYLTSQNSSGAHYELGSTGGVLGTAAGVVAMIVWFAIVFTGRCPTGLWNFIAYYVRWRVRAAAYVSLLRDEYPPFGDGVYPAGVDLAPDALQRDRLTVAFRIFLAIPHLIVVWALGFAWAITTFVAWLAILFTGRYPEPLYRFGVDVLRWTTRVEAYVLLLHDAYPPFSFD